MAVRDGAGATRAAPGPNQTAARSAARKRQPNLSSVPATDGDSSMPTRLFLVVIGLSALLVGVYIQVTKNISESLNKSAIKRSHTIDGRGDTLIVADNLDAGYLDHVIGSLLKFGHQLSFRGSLNTPNKLSDIDQFSLIWTHDYPFQFISKLDPRQRINHFPGTGFITNKMTLSTTPNVPGILKAFRLPWDRDKFLDYTKEHPKKMWIQKSSSHRGISVESASSVNLDAQDSLIQEFMDNPLLIDGKKFDIGIYAVLTSVDPMRIYIYEAESLLRFCADPYLDRSTKAFNSSNLDSYVVGDDYTPIWLMPSLVRHYIGVNMSMKQTLNSYLRRLGKDGSHIWEQIDAIIKSVYRMKEPHLARMSRVFQAANNYNSTSVEGSLNQFFEMVRFDFIIDENLTVYLMEANMSPNLSSRHFPPNRLLYEQVLQSYYSLVGLTQFAQEHLTDLPVQHLDGKLTLPRNNLRSGSTFGGDRFGLDGIIGEKELSVYEDLCVSDECHMNCNKSDCLMCYFCLDESTKLHLRRAIYEQFNKWNFKRLLPSTRDEDIKMQLVHPDNPLSNTVDANYIHVQWFRGKCHSDARFCSEKSTSSAA